MGERQTLHHWGPTVSEEALVRLKTAITEGNEEAATRIAEEIVSSRKDLSPVMSDLTKSMQQIGDKFSRLEIFLTDLMLAAAALKAVIEVFRPVLSTSGEIANFQLGDIVIGTVKGDIHDIGKNIVSAMLTSAGFMVHDVGVDVPADKFLEMAEEGRARIIAASALMTTTLPMLEELIRLLEESGDREKYKVLIGGGAVTDSYSQRIRADGFAKDSAGAARVAKTLMSNLAKV